MKTTIDSAGRLVIPQELRREAGLQPGTELEIRWRQGLIEIEPAPLPIKLKNRGRFLVAMPDHPIEQLITKTVKRTSRQLTRDRAARVKTLLTFNTRDFLSLRLDSIDIRIP